MIRHPRRSLAPAAALLTIQILELARPADRLGAAFDKAVRAQAK